MMHVNFILWFLEIKENYSCEKIIGNSIKGFENVINEQS